MCAGIIRDRCGQEEEGRYCERGEDGEDEQRRDEFVYQGFSTVGPDVGCAAGRCSGKRRDGVDDETPFLVGLQAVDNDVGQ